MNKEKYKFIAVKESTHLLIEREKNKRSVEYGKTVTYDQLLKERFSTKDMLINRLLERKK